MHIHRDRFRAVANQTNAGNHPPTHLQVNYKFFMAQGRLIPFEEEDEG